jgi:hypothetical protein
MAANWQSTESFAVPQAIDETSTVKRNPIGMVISARDISTQPASGTGTQGNATGEGQFIYLVATAANAVGMAVMYELPDSTDLNGSTTLITNSNAKGSIAIAMASFGVGEFGWYQIYGNAVINNSIDGGTAHLGAADVPLYACATAGCLSSTPINSVGILTSYVILAKGEVSTYTCLARIQYPSVFTQTVAMKL